jgi:diguanylate cyclase (GGDEF)-like protein
VRADTEGSGGSDGRLRHVVALAQAMSASQTRREAVRAAAEHAMAAQRATFAAISVWERETGRLRVLVNYGELSPDEEELPEDESYPVAEYPEIARFLEQRGLGEAWTSDGLPRAWVQTVDDRPDGPEADADLPGAPGLSRNGPFCRERVAGLRKRRRGCCLVAPIVLRGRAWGELYLGRPVGAPVFDDRDAEFATVLAAQISAGLAQSERLEEVSRLAFTDPLTGLANRRAVDARLDEALERHRADGTVVSLVMCDVNGLKQVNDERGHEIGDRLLERFANQLSLCGAKLPGSVAGRLGGDEFCLVAEGAQADEVIAVAEELCARAMRIEEGHGVACGIASTGDAIGPVTTADRLFRLADAAQYRAKAGRATHPVVAGRGAAPDSVVRLADSPPAQAGAPARERRRFRGATRSANPAALISAVLAVLDASAFPLDTESADGPSGAAGGSTTLMPAPAPKPAPAAAVPVGAPAAVPEAEQGGPAVTDEAPGGGEQRGDIPSGGRAAAVRHRVHPGDSLGRLRLVAETTARMVDAVAWWISYVPPGSPLMRTAAYGVERMTAARARSSAAGGGDMQRAVIEAPDAVFDLRSYPLTSRAVRGDAFSLRAGAPGNDPAEEAVLVVGGYRGMVAAGGRNVAGGWLVEVFADEATLPLAGVAPALRALVAVALSGPASAPD